MFAMLGSYILALVIILMAILTFIAGFFADTSGLGRAILIIVGLALAAYGWRIVKYLWDTGKPIRSGDSFLIGGFERESESDEGDEDDSGE